MQARESARQLVSTSSNEVLTTSSVRIETHEVVDEVDEVRGKEAAMKTPTSLDRMAKLARAAGWSAVVLDGMVATRDDHAPTSILRCARDGSATVVVVWRWKDDGKAGYEAGIVVAPLRLLGHGQVKAYLAGELDLAAVDGRPCDDRTHSPRVVAGAWTCPECGVASLSEVG